MEADELLHLIDNLEDERSRARVREGIYISLLAHVLIFLWILFGPRYILHRPKVISPFDVLTDRQKKEMTYLSLPPDALKNIQPKNPKALSDKNRVAESRHPTLDKKTLEQLQAMRRAGPPAPAPAPQQQAPEQTAPHRSSRNRRRPGRLLCNHCSRSHRERLQRLRPNRSRSRRNRISTPDCRPASRFARQRVGPRNRRHPAATTAPTSRRNMPDSTAALKF
jgi:hypothetical protein